MSASPAPRPTPAVSSAQPARCASTTNTLTLTSGTRAAENLTGFAADYTSGVGCLGDPEIATFTNSTAAARTVFVQLSAYDPNAAFSLLVQVQ